VIAIVVVIGLAVAVVWSPLFPGDTEDSVLPEDELTPPDEEVPPEDELTPPDDEESIDPDEALADVEIDSMHFTLTTVREVQMDPEAPPEVMESVEEVMIRGIRDKEIDYRVDATMGTEEMIELYNYEEGRVYAAQTNPQTEEEEWIFQELRIEEDPGFLLMVADYGERAEEYGIGEHDITDEFEGVESAVIKFHEIDGTFPAEEFLPPEDADPQPYEPPGEQMPDEDGTTP
ncbi:MAG: hypothetical protein ACOC6G_04175, partial [Thermoproteota archaeon]